MKNQLSINLKKIFALTTLLFCNCLIFAQIEYVKSFWSINEDNQFYLFGSQELHVSKNGKFLYAFSDSLLLQYELDSLNGEALSLKTYHDKLHGLKSPSLNCGRNYAVTGDGKYLYLTSYCHSAISVFRLDNDTGNCSFVSRVVNNEGGITGLDSPYGVAISRDDKFAYVAEKTNNQIKIFNIDQADGKLTYMGANNHSKLAGVHYVKTTPDNKYLYAYSSNDTSLKIFLRDEVNGQLTFLKEMMSEPDKGVYLKGISNIEFDTTYNYIYITAAADSALNIFSYNNSYAELILSKSFREKKNGITGLDQPVNFCISSDKKFIYVLSRNYKKDVDTRSISVFKVIDGEVEFVSTKKLGKKELTFLKGIKVSKDSRFIYISEMTSSLCQIYKPGLFPDLGDTLRICMGDSAVKLNEEYVSYTWLENLNDSAVSLDKGDTLVIEVADAFGKTGKDTLILDYLELPEINLGTDKDMVLHDTLKLTVEQGFEKYLWSTGGITNSIIYVADSIIEKDLVTIIATGKYGCSVKDSIAITVLGPAWVTEPGNDEIRVYPNPFSNYLTLSGDNLVLFDKIELVEVSGKVIYFKELEERDKELWLDLTKLKRGVYILTLSNKQERLTKRLVKR